MKKFSVVIVGGGSTYTPDMMELMCVVKKSFPLKKIVLYDIDKERQDLVGKYGEILFNEYYPELEKYHYTTIHEEAFKDIDFAFVQIRAGGLESRNIDEKIPLNSLSVSIRKEVRGKCFHYLFIVWHLELSGLHSFNKKRSWQKNIKLSVLMISLVPKKVKACCKTMVLR